MPTALLEGEIRTYIRTEAEANMFILNPGACVCTSSTSISSHQTLLGLYPYAVVCSCEGEASPVSIFGISAEEVKGLCTCLLDPVWILGISGIATAICSGYGVLTPSGVAIGVNAVCSCLSSGYGVLRRLAGYVVSSGRRGSVSDSRKAH